MNPYRTQAIIPAETKVKKFKPKWRILKVASYSESDGTPYVSYYKYYIQKRVCFFFWKNITYKLKDHEAIDYAKNEIKNEELLKQKEKPKVIWDDKNF